MLKKLRAEREKQTKIMSAIAGTERDAGTGMTDEEKRSFDEASARVKEIDSEISRIEELRALQTETAVEAHSDNDVEEFRSFLKGEEVRTQTVGTNSQGGFTAGASVQNRLIQAMKSMGGMIENSSAISTSTGNAMQYPTNDDTDNEAVIKDEIAARRQGPDLVFGSIALKSFDYDSGIVKVSKTLLRDSSIDIENVVINALAARLRRKLQKDCTVGIGTTEPSGILNSSSLGLTAASATEITADELLKMTFKIDEVYESKAKWMMNKNTLEHISLLKNTDGDYLIADPKAGTTRSLFGKKIIVNNNMPDIATGETPLIYGDIGQYLIRNVEGMQVERLNELYAETNQIGYKANLSADGVLLNVDAVKHMVMA